MLVEFVKQLQQLSYADMMQFSKLVSEELKEIHSPAHLADALSKVAQKPLKEAPSTEYEAKITRELFSRRRSISIKEFNGGFKIELQTLHGQVLHKDLKVGIGQLIDTLVAARALSGN